MTRRPPPPKRAIRASAPQSMEAVANGNEQASVQLTEALDQPAVETAVTGEQPPPTELAAQEGLVETELTAQKGGAEPVEGASHVAVGQSVPVPQVTPEPEPAPAPLEAPRDRFLELLMSDLTAALGIPATIVSIEVCPQGRAEEMKVGQENRLKLLCVGSTGDRKQPPWSIRRSGHHHRSPPSIPSGSSHIS